MTEIKKMATARVLTALIAIAGTRVRAQDAGPPLEPSPTPEPARAAVMHALPVAGSITARAVQLNAGLVLEREESAGLFPAEPSRLVFRGGSWTQTRFEVERFDVTDPVSGGRPLVWGAADVGAVDVTTDARGTLVTQLGPRWDLPAHAQFVAQTNLGLFDSRGATQAPIPSLARGHHLFDGLIGGSRSLRGGATRVSGVISGADVSRSERESDLERSTARLGFEGRARHTRDDDRFQGLAMYQGTRGPFGLTAAETRSTGLLLGSSWIRTGNHRTHARISYLRGTTDDPPFTSPPLFERLVEGTPAQQVPYNTGASRLQAEFGKDVSVGAALRLLFAARLSRATDTRVVAQPKFVALERLNGVPAREWTFAAAAPSGSAENQVALSLGFGAETSKRTRLTGKVEVQRVTVGDRDGARVLGSNKVLPELRFEWKKSEKTGFYFEASIATPPVPLVSYEGAGKNAPSSSARLWHDLNGDGRATAPELGAEVARRGPGLLTVDPDLSRPTMRRVIIGFNTKARGLHIRATGFARRDVNLVETALNPQGSEVLRIRNLPDPSGDILGASDDQILALVEETSASFTSSQFLLTNPLEHRALGEGAELAFETHAKHVHWGLLGAAFRDSGRGGNRGLRVSENDFGVVGESFDRTNADTFGYGRLFFDRAYSLKMYLTANDVSGFTFGAIARYDDGQPFARVVIRNDLPQGPDFVQAIPRGRARLHYTLSVDARLARKFEVSGTNIELSASVFNALGSQFEAEEQVVWQADYRRTTMVQPPRAFTIGVRIER